MNPVIGKNIKQIRVDNGLTQSEFAERVGVDSSYISKIESGEKYPSDRVIKLICIQFGVIDESLLSKDGHKYKKIIYQKRSQFGIIKDDYFYPTSSINYEEYELIKAVRELDLISRKGIYLSAIIQLNEAMRERNIKKDKSKKEILDKIIKSLTKAVGEM